MKLNPPALFVLSATGTQIARKVAAVTGGTITGLQNRQTGADLEASTIGDEMRQAFSKPRPIIAVMASGSVIRILAGLLQDKQCEPPVVVISEDGSSVVPLLGGHHGANDLAREIAVVLDAHAAITTAGDLRFNIALDAPPVGWTIGNPQNAKGVMAALLAGKECCLEGNASNFCQWIEDSALPIKSDGEVCLFASTRKIPDELGPLDLMFIPKVNVLGMGCERGTSTQEAIQLAEKVLEEADIAPQSIACVASIDVKADEVAIHAVADHFGVEAIFYRADQLEAEADRLKHPSEIVFAEVGCHGVSEGAALAAVGRDGHLLVAKNKSKRVTAAIGQAGGVIEMEKLKTQTGAVKRGKLFVVGIGPGQEGWRSPEVSRMILQSTDLVGYSLYLDLIEEICEGKTRHDFDLGKEEDRVRHAMELAGEGRDVALVCSGDAGIYAMATLVFELLESGGLSDPARRIEIAVSPGISALQAAAARAGAPLGHDFCTISLSDLLTPWEAIKMRVKAAAEGDFVIAFYNPVSKRRRTQLAYAKEVLLKHRPASTPVILATNLGREEENVRIVALSDLDIDEVDMLTVVVVGSCETRIVETGEGKKWVYTPRGYAAKEGTQINVAGAGKNQI